ncbi:hypothetical protein JCM31447_17320 [Fluviispira sanaruensis]|uniref:Uncharacterized protein n=2 Tax=Fluviispira sanaruensis TaxID=2493639 RepID=A0A4P2VNR7_FLUSA|nr:hypothetical protein JCM31447_17320 [Fluviispira sanaruensis]
MTDGHMVLTKLWQQQKPEISNPSHSQEEIGLQFLHALYKQLDKDLMYLSGQKDLPKKYFFGKIKVTFGSMSLDQFKNKPYIRYEKKYLFLHIPNHAGFLLEPSNNIEKIFLYRATKVMQQLSNEMGESSRPELFILKSDIIEEFKIIDDNYVRTGNEKTLSVAQMSEMLLLLADSL